MPTHNGDESGEPPPPPTMADVLMQIERNRMDQTRLLEQLVHNTTNPAAGSDIQRHGGFVNFLKTEPPKFSRAEDPLVADDWLRNVERKLKYSRCTENEKVLFASYLLEGAASAWYENFVAMQPPDHEVTWESFSKAFRAAHIPDGIMALMKKQFLDLKQGEHSVREYLDEFTYLSRYAPRDVPDDAAKIERSMNGLSLELQDKLVAQDFRDFAHLVNKAIVCESKGKALEEERKRKREAQKNASVNFKFPRPCYDQSASHPPRAPPAPQRERVANSRPQSPNLQRQNYGGKPRNNQPETRSCYTCGQPGHISPNCPNKQPRAPRNNQQQQGRPQAQPPIQRHQFKPPNNVHGRVNHVTAEEAQESPNVVLDSRFKENTESEQEHIKANYQEGDFDPELGEFGPEHDP